MPFLAFLLFSVLVLGQTDDALLGIHSHAVVVRAGVPDVKASILIDPSPEGGDFFAVMAMAEGMRIRIQLPDGRSITKETAASAGFIWEVAPQGQEEALLIPGLQGKENHQLNFPPNAPKGKYEIHVDATALQQNSAIRFFFLPLGRDTVRVTIKTIEPRPLAGDTVHLALNVFDVDAGIAKVHIRAQAVALDKSDMPIGKPVPVKFQRGWASRVACGKQAIGHRQVPLLLSSTAIVPAIPERAG